MIRNKQSGIALVLVMWFTVLLTVASGAYALMARMDRLEANTLLSGTQARMTAEAGIHLMAVALRDTDDLSRPVADGRTYEQVIDGVLLEISATDERGKLDINTAEEPTLVTLFMSNGLDVESAELLAAAVLDWRDPDEVIRVNGAELDTYMAAGLPVGPANRPFMMVDELLQVLGMSYALFERIEPGISVYSRAGVPDLAYAPVEALMAVPDVSLEDAQDFVAERNTLEAGNLQGLALPSGQAAMAQGRGLTYSIVAKATMPNGVWEQVEATIRLGGSHTGLPFRVLRWREGFHH